MIGDTILAPASPPGAGARAVLRFSGPMARAAAGLVFRGALPAERGIAEGAVVVRGRAVAAMALGMPGPGSFTGEDVVELHVPGAPLLVQCLQEDLLARGGELGLRLALPGEFTARACVHGRLDLAAAEGILMLLHAADRRELASGAAWLGGAARRDLAALRAAMQDTLAQLESGLDFTAEETGAVDGEAVGVAIAAHAAAARDLLAQVPAAAPGGEVVLVGAANAGKSSLCNALAGRAVVLVDAVPGTTRDLVRVDLADGVVLWDAPGDLDAPSTWDEAALALRDRLLGRAAAALVVLDAAAPVVPRIALDAAVPVLAVVYTKRDRGPAPAGVPPELVAARGSVPPVATTSAVTGEGLEALGQLLRRSARAGAVAIGAPLRATLGALVQALDGAGSALAAGPEVAAVLLQAGLRALDEAAGDGSRHTAEDLLDRIYGRFCLGK
ncbi:MAG: GTPase [Planctomycetota bacterium]